MRSVMDAATLEDRARAVATQWVQSADSHDPAAGAAAAMAAAGGLARYLASSAEALFDPSLMSRLGGIAFIPATQVPTVSALISENP